MSHKVVVKTAVIEEGDEMPVPQSEVLTSKPLSDGKLKIWYTKIE